MRGLSLASHLEDRKNGHKPPQGGGAVGSGPWVFNTSQTAGTLITDGRMYHRLALGEGDPRYPIIHGCDGALCGPECRAPAGWAADEIDAGMRDLHLVEWKIRPGGERYLGCSCLGFWHVRMCSHTLVILDMLGIYRTKEVPMCINVC